MRTALEECVPVAMDRVPRSSLERLRRLPGGPLSDGAEDFARQLRPPGVTSRVVRAKVVEESEGKRERARVVAFEEEEH